MATVEMVMPKMGESVMEGTILQWLKQVGDPIEEDESVLEVATDKVDTEVPATHAGVLKEILAQEGDVIEVGKPIALIETEADEAVAVAPDTTPSAPTAAAPTPTAAAAQQATASPADDRFYSPLVRSIAKEEGIAADEMARIPGTGKDHRVTKRDILQYIEQRQAPAPAPERASPAPQAETPRPEPAAAPQPTAPRPAAAPAPRPAASVNGSVEIIEMDRMRRMIAERMIESKRTSAHVTSFVEADVTPLVRWRERVKDDFRRREGTSITFTPLFVEAIVRAIKDFPLINISVEGDRMLRKQEINVGIAVALPSGNLIVPVIHRADQYNLVGLAHKVNDLAQRARDNKLRPDELSGGTYTLSNVGTFGNVMGTPIIMQPQVAIMAVGAIRKKPAVIETPEGDLIGIRQMMFLSHSYDHRVVDGALGGMFVRRVADYLEGFDPERAF